MSQRQNCESEESSSSSGEWDGLPSPDVLRKYRQPKWYMERGAQTEDGWYAGPHRGLGIPHRPVRGRLAAATQGAGDRACRAYHPRRCGLCNHEHSFDTRTGLNNHSSKQHSYYYSLKGDCFAVDNLEAILSPPPAMTEMAVVALDNTASPVGPPSLELAGPGCTNEDPSSPVSPVALVGCLSLRVYLRDYDPPRPETPPLPMALSEGVARDTQAVSGGSRRRQSPTATMHTTRTTVHSFRPGCLMPRPAARCTIPQPEIPSRPSTLCQWVCHPRRTVHGLPHMGALLFPAGGLPSCPLEASRIAISLILTARPIG